MKDNSSLKSLNRKLEVKFKEAQLYLSKLEAILRERKEVESLILEKINMQKLELDQARRNNKSLFLTGVLKAESIREEQIKFQIQSLDQELLSAKGECRVAEERIAIAKLELGSLHKEREGFLKIEDERDIQNERIKVETTDSN